LGLGHADHIAWVLERVHRLFDEAGIWHAVTWGTLLGAVRDRDVIPWDGDFDLVVRPSDVQAIVDLNPVAARDGLAFLLVRPPGHRLVVNMDGIATFSGSSLVVHHWGKGIGDVYFFSLFADGVLRRFDFTRQVYWCPCTSFVHWFAAETEPVVIRGVTYPGLRDAERWLESVYGPDWHTPRQSERRGGPPQPGRSGSGDRLEPHMAEDLAWAAARGMRLADYEGLPAWPREIRGVGPRGEFDETGLGAEFLATVGARY
jgi:hypothetical protein